MPKIGAPMLSKAQKENASRDRGRQRQAPERAKQAMNGERDSTNNYVLNGHLDFSWIFRLLLCGYKGNGKTPRAERTVFWFIPANRIPARRKILRWIRSFSRMRAIVFFWLEATAMSVEQDRIKRANLGVVDDPIASLNQDRFMSDKKHDFHMFHLLYECPPR